MSHEELVDELRNLENRNVSEAARQKLAEKRRNKQLQNYREQLRLQRQTGGRGSASVLSKKCPPVIKMAGEAVLNDMVARNDTIGGQCSVQYRRYMQYCGNLSNCMHASMMLDNINKFTA